MTGHGGKPDKANPLYWKSLVFSSVRIKEDGKVEKCKQNFTMVGATELHSRIPI